MLAFAGAMGLVLAYALRGSGAYDLVVRQEYALVLWWALAVGVALGVLPRRRPGLVASAVLICLVAYAAWVALSLIWTESAERTTAELARALGYIGLVALVGSILGRENWRAAAHGLAAGAFLVCALALASRLAPGSFPPNNAGLVFGVSRLSYPFGYWNAVGAWAAMSVTIGLGWSAGERRPVPRAFALGMVPMCATVVYLTYSRAAITAGVLGVIVVMVAGRHRWTALIHAAIAAGTAALAVLAVRWHGQIADGTGTSGAGSFLVMLAVCVAVASLGARVTQSLGTDYWVLPKRPARLVAGATVAVLLLAGVVFGPSLITRGWHEFKNPHIASGSDPAARLRSLSGQRYQLWTVALKAFDDHPLTGTGAGTYEFWWNQNATLAEFVRNAHSLWIESMGELGLPGVLLLVAAALSAVWLAVSARLRSRSSSSAAVAVASLAAFAAYLVTASVDWMWQSTAVTALALAGLATCSLRVSRERAPRRWFPRSAIAAVCVVAGLVQVPGLLSTEAMRRSQAAARRGDTSAALAWADHAVSAEPWAASPYLQRGLVLEADGRLARAATDLRRATKREPTNYVHWLILARVEAEQGRFAQATRDEQQGRQLRPGSAIFAAAGQ